jgi:hypothetical protein
MGQIEHRAADMKEQGRTTCKMPEGRILYTPTDIFRYVIVTCTKLKGYWITNSGWSTNDDAAGPFQPTDALRAYRLANTIVPERIGVKRESGS